MKKVAIVGHFAFGKEFLDGQTVKTKILAQELERVYGTKNVKKIDTHGNKLKMMLSVVKSVFSMLTCKNIVILPAHNGVRVFVPVLSALKCFFKCKLHYAVIGGWLPEYIRNKNSIKKGLKKFHGVYVETTAMKNALEKMGYDNIFIMPNCKNLNILKEEELVYNTEKPYKFCTFSRVMKEKGIEDAVNVVKKVNEKYGETVCSLDIYGQVDSGQKDWFEELKTTFPDYIKYGGLVPFDKSTEVLKEYFALLFPTHYYTEGIPGTIIDAYAAGIPIISAKWENYNDIVLENQTGFLFEIQNNEEFKGKLIEIYENIEKLNSLKENCIKEAEKFLPKNVIDILVKKLK